MKTEFPFFQIEVEGPIATIWLNKPNKRNAMDWSFWRDLPLVVEEINSNKEIRAFLIAGRGKSFSTGLDLNGFFSEFLPLFQGEHADDREKLYQLILDMQKGINAVYDSPKPSIALVQKHCIGGGLDLISACDIRYMTEDASVSLREAKVAIVADMGSLNRLPGIIGQGNTRELALTGKDIDGKEALRMGLANKIFSSFEEMLSEGKKTAQEIADNPSIVIRGVKQVLRYSEGKPMEAGLNYVAVWNAGMLDSKDFREAMNSFQQKKRPNYNQN